MAATSRSKFLSLFQRARIAVVGMVHVQALPGTPKGQLSVNEIIEAACQEAEVYRDCGVDGVMVENMHDGPYLRGSVGPEITACMTCVCAEVCRVTKDVPVGVQILSGANMEALAVAKASGACFIRTESFVFSHVADEGWMDSCAAELLRYRRAIGAEDILVFTDIKKKHWLSSPPVFVRTGGGKGLGMTLPQSTHNLHEGLHMPLSPHTASHVVTSDLNIADMARAADFFLSDGVILTGPATGLPANTDEITAVKNAVDLPLLIGSGVTVENLEQYTSADALIVGSHFKVGGQWHNRVDKDRVAKFMGQLHKLFHVGT